jgi:hypothetical protein
MNAGSMLALIHSSSGRRISTWRFTTSLQNSQMLMADNPIGSPLGEFRRSRRAAAGILSGTDQYQA